MSAFLAKDDLIERLHESGSYCVLLDETTVLNLPVVMAMLGLGEESAKKWCAKYGVRRMPGRTWLTNGRQFFRAMERYFEESGSKDEAG